MTGYVGTKFAESYGIVVDFVDPELTELVRVRIPLLNALPRACLRDLHVDAKDELWSNSLLAYFFAHFRSMPASTVIFPFVRRSADMPVSCLPVIVAAMYMRDSGVFTQNS